MNKNKLIELIKNNRDAIITRIEQIEVASLTPGFHGTYDIYIDAKGCLYVFQCFHSTENRIRDGLIFLCSIRSNAIDNMQAFKEYLLYDLGLVVRGTTTNLTKDFSYEYEMWKSDLKENVRQNVINADRTYEKILELFTSLTDDEIDETILNFKTGLASRKE